MVISDPPVCLDLASVGQKVRYNQYKYESMDGFVKQDEECFIILPSVHKQAAIPPPNVSANSQSPSSIIAGGSSGSLGEVLLKAHVLPLSYEFP